MKVFAALASLLGAGAMGAGVASRIPADTVAMGLGVILGAVGDHSLEHGADRGCTGGRPGDPDQGRDARSAPGNPAAVPAGGWVQAPA